MAIRPFLVMTKPSAFEVSYVINPWMQPQIWRQSAQLLRTRARVGWNRLKKSLESHGIRICLIDAAEHLPDLVFPANAGVVLDGRVLLGHFAHPQRQAEEPVLLSFFEDLQRKGKIQDIQCIPKSIVQEGAGDCLWDARRNLFWAGYGQRSEKSAARRIAFYFDCEVQTLELVDPRFYHLDVALAALEYGELMYFPGAFSKVSRDLIRQCVPLSQRIEVDESDAIRFNLNVISANGCLFMTPPGERLRALLQERGYRLCEIDLSPFMLAGGAAACLGLRLDFQRGPQMQIAHKERINA